MRWEMKSFALETAHLFNTPYAIPDEASEKSPFFVFRQKELFGS